MDAHVERLLARVAADCAGDRSNNEELERMYEVALYAHTHDAVPSIVEVKTFLVTFGCSLQKATALSDWFSDLCAFSNPMTRKEAVVHSWTRALHHCRATC